MLGLLGFLSPIWDVVKGILGVITSTEQAKYTAEATEVAATDKAESEVQTRWWFVAAITPLFSIPYVIYLWKVIVWDTVLGWGTTPPLRGDASTVMLMIVGFYFFHNMALNINRS